MCVCCVRWAVYVYVCVNTPEQTNNYLVERAVSMLLNRDKYPNFHNGCNDYAPNVRIHDMAKGGWGMGRKRSLFQQRIAFIHQTNFVILVSVWAFYFRCNSNLASKRICTSIYWTKKHLLKKNIYWKKTLHKKMQQNHPKKNAKNSKQNCQNSCTNRINWNKNKSCFCLPCLQCS